MDALFDTYSAALPRVRAWVDATFPRADGEPEAARARAVNAKALDLLRGLLPAASLSHMGIYATGQAYEQLILHLIGHPLPEARRYGELILAAIKAVMPSFVARVERPDRGGAWAGYLAERRAAGERWAARLGLEDADPADARPSVTLTHVDGDEEQLLAALLFEAAGASEERRPARRSRRSRTDERGALLARPGRRARQPPPPPRPRLRGAALPLRDRLGLRRVPRPPAPPHADRAVAGLTPDLGAGVPEEVVAAGAGDAYRARARPLGRRVPPPRRRRPRRRRAVRALPRLPDPLRARPQRARGDAPDRAALRPRGPPGLPRGRPPDARPDRRAPPGGRGRDDARRRLGRAAARAHPVRDAPGVAAAPATRRAERRQTAADSARRLQPPPSTSRSSTPRRTGGRAHARQGGSAQSARRPRGRPRCQLAPQRAAPRRASAAAPPARSGPRAARAGTPAASRRAAEALLELVQRRARRRRAADPAQRRLELGDRAVERGRRAVAAPAPAQPHPRAERARAARAAEREPPPRRAAAVRRAPRPRRPGRTAGRAGRGATPPVRGAEPPSPRRGVAAVRARPRAGARAPRSASAPACPAGVGSNVTQP